MHSAQRTQLPTALLTFNDAVAIGALLELRHAAVRVPDQISVIGYDDVAMSALPHIRLTSVGQDVRQTARRALTCATRAASARTTEQTSLSFWAPGGSQTQATNREGGFTRQAAQATKPDT